MHPAAEATNISRHGLWLLLGDEELFLPFAVESIRDPQRFPLVSRAGA